MVQDNLCRFCLFYYSLDVDKNMDRWVLIQVHKHCDTRERFVYSKTLDYVQQMSRYQGIIEGHLPRHY
jgi:hypothetical protein